MLVVLLAVIAVTSCVVLLFRFAVAASAVCRSGHCCLFVTSVEVCCQNTRLSKLFCFAVVPFVVCLCCARRITLFVILLGWLCHVVCSCSPNRLLICVVLFCLFAFFFWRVRWSARPFCSMIHRRCFVACWLSMPDVALSAVIACRESLFFFAVCVISACLFATFQTSVRVNFGPYLSCWLIVSG